MKLTQKLLGFLNRVFSKDPDAFLALRLQYAGGMVWKIRSGILSTVVTGGIGASLTVDLSKYTVRQLVSYLAAQPGYSIPYAENGPLADLSARVLIDGGADIATSNGDHVSGYTSLLWSYVDAGGKELVDAAAQIDQMLLQMDTHTASAEWLDELGGYYGIARDGKGTLLAAAATNAIRNNTMGGAVAGSPGTLPTNWAIGGASGLSTAVIGTGVEGGITYIDLRLYGTATGTSAGIRPESATGAVPASPGQAWAFSAYARMVGGSLATGMAAAVAFNGRDSNGVTTADSFNASCTSLGAASLSASRPAVTGMLVASTTASLIPQVLLTYPSGAVIDITLRIGMPQLEMGGAATAAIATSGTVATRPAVYGAESDAVYAPRIIAEVLRPRSNNVAIELALQQYTGQAAQVVDVVEYGTSSGQFVYNSAYTFNGAKQYNSSSQPIYGKFDVVYSYDLLGGTDPTAFAGTVRDLINRLRAAGTHLRAMSLQTSAISDAVTPPTDGGDLAYVGKLALADAGPAPSEQMSALSGALAALADTVAGASDGVSLAVTYGSTYGGARAFNGKITYANTGSPVAESF